MLYVYVVHCRCRERPTVTHSHPAEHLRQPPRRPVVVGGPKRVILDDHGMVVVTHRVPGLAGKSLGGGLVGERIGR